VVDELALALMLDRRVQLGGGLRTIEIPQGLVVLNEDLPDVHDVNAVRVRAPLPEGLDASGLVDLAERWLGHLRHRLVRLDDGDAGERLAAEMIGAGWERRRTVFMVLRATTRDAVRDPRAREISDAELQALMLAINEQADFGIRASASLPQQLVDAQSASRAGTCARCFGAGEDGGLQSMCTLFLHPDIAGARMAMVEQAARSPPTANVAWQRPWCPLLLPAPPRGGQI
jgi:hypothetical protein